MGESQVSIIMPAYNAADFIGDSIESVLNQTYSEWELIVVDDCSSDETGTVIKKYQSKDERIKYVQHKTNQGVSGSRNTGIGLAKSKYIAFLDSDDLWLPYKLEKQLKFMEQNNVSFSYTQYRHFKKSSNEQGKLIEVIERIDYRQLLFGNQIGCLTVILERSLLGDFRFQHIGHEDYALWLRILRTGATAYGIREDLARYRISEKSISRNKLQCASWTWRIYRDAENLSFIESGNYFISYVIRGFQNHYLS